MDFSEKLNFLFELTHAEGKELASAMNITPPQISKMRKGIRGLPRDVSAARILARFFALRCSSDFQRDLLSKALRVSQIRNVVDDSELTDILLDWLSDDRDPDAYAAKRADGFLRQFGSLYDSGGALDSDKETSNTMSFGQSSFIAYYGSDGKRLAVQAFLNYLLRKNEPYTINILTDESIAWVTEDPSYSKQLFASMKHLTEQGCTFRRISGQIVDMDQAFESLNRWMPLYMTGKATSYSYKRMRDSLNRITLFVVPNVAVMFSFSVGVMSQQNSVTFFTADEKTASAMAAEFDNYLSMCEPIMNVYSPDDSPKQFFDCMIRYESYEGRCIQRSDSLSFITLPWDIAVSLKPGKHAEDKENFLNTFAQRYKEFKSNIEQCEFVDIIRVADIDQILKGEVPIPAAHILGGEMQCYTPEKYLQHLRSIIYLLGHKKNYHVVLRTTDDTDSTNVYVKEGFRAILTRDSYPFSLFEVSERYLVDAFTEYLRRGMHEFGNDAAYKHQVIAELREFAARLERLINEPNL